MFQYLTTIKLSCFNYIVLRLLPWNLLKTNNFTIQHVVYCCHSNHYNCFCFFVFFFPNLFLLFLKMSYVVLYLESFHQYIEQGRILSFVNLVICILKSLTYRWTYSIGRLHRPHSSNISETAGSTQIQCHIKPLRHLGNKHFSVKMIQSCHQYIRLANIHCCI